MKVILPLFAAAVCALVAGVLLFAGNGSAPAPQGDGDDGHVLKSLWKEYEEARLADRPKKMLEALDNIKAEAISRHLIADFYDAGKLRVDRGRSINWKDYDSLKTAFSKDVEAFDEPIVTFIWGEEYGGKGQSSQMTLVRGTVGRLKETRTPVLWERFDGAFESYDDFIKNDYEFALWRLLYESYFSYSGRENNAPYAALKEYFGDSYPGAAKLEYFAVSHIDKKEDRIAEYRRLAAKYKGKAFSMYPKEDILEYEFDSLGRAKAPEKAYRELYEACKVYLKEKNSYTGNEKKLIAPLTGVQNLADRLTNENISLRVKNDTVRVTFQNLEKATLTLSTVKSDGTADKLLKTWNITNKKKSFYLEDLETVNVPVLDDGDYRFDVVSGKYSAYRRYLSRTISLAIRHDADGYRFYSANYVTGQPLEAVKLSLMKEGKVLKEETVTQHGFTKLPDSMTKSLERYTTYYVRASYTDQKGLYHRSNDVSLYDRKLYADDDKFSEHTYCDFYKDKGAYNPDDIMHFKAVIYKGNLGNAVKALPAGETVKVTLTNASGKEIAAKELKTTEFGSVSGEFLLARGEKNGMYSVNVHYNGKSVKTESFRVDDFILPTYTVSLDKIDVLVSEGDTVKIKGRVATFSGHSLTSANVKICVRRYSGPCLVQETQPETDGTFSIDYRVGDYGSYSIDATVVDATGETVTASSHFYVTRYFSLTATFANKADGSAFLVGDERAMPVLRSYWRPVNPAPSTPVISGTSVDVRFAAKNSDRVEIPMEIRWKLLRDDDGGLVHGGVAQSGDKRTIDMSDVPSGLYTIEMEAIAEAQDGKTVQSSEKVRFLLVKPADKKIKAPVRRVIIYGKTRLAPGENIQVRYGSNDGPTWAVATLYGLNCTLLETRIVKLASGEVKDLEFTYKDNYPDAVRLQIFSFKYGQEILYDKVYRRERNAINMPVSFSRFTDKARPATQYTFTVKGFPGAEALAAVWDKSLDAIARNCWSTVSLEDPPISSISTSTATGSVSGSDPYRFSPAYVPGEDVDEPDDDFVFDNYRSSAGVKTKSAGKGAALGAAGGAVLEAPMMLEKAVAAVEDVAEEVTVQDAAEAEKVTVREVFADALTFQPHLRSDANGDINFTFSTSDKLSTYYVAVYAHDKDMRNGYTVSEMQVTVPVKVAVVEPKYLYETDAYRMGVTVSSNSDEPVAGKLMLFLYPGTDHEHLQPVSALRKQVTVPVGGSVSETFDVAPGVADTLGVKVVFSADSGEAGFSDAVFLPIDVRPAVQTLTEAHSAVWLHGTDKEALKRNLQARFVNVPASEAAYDEITILEMVKEALPGKYESSGKDVLSLSETYYVQLISESLKTGVKALPEGSAEVLKKVLACQNKDGGFGWFEGMTSSRIITAVLLERFAQLRDRGFEVPDLAAAVHFLDKGQFSEEYPLWCGWVSDAQYLYVRAMYAAVPFEYKPSTKEEKEYFAEFKADTKAYLVPSKKAGRGLDGYILGKARRIKTLRALASSREGIALAKAFGVKLSAKNRMDKSMVADLLSLVEYSVKHPDGGYYYPNAVMPFRGLLESEAYAHSLICDLLTSVGMEKNDAIRTETGDDAGVIADGIRLWLMLQKETQKWEEDPGFVNAISSILDGSEEVLATEVLIYKATYTKPFADIKAAGNGFTVGREFYREKKDSRDLEPIAPGTVLQRGDRIVARYVIWNKENRSFVKLTAPREASLRPVNQLSGHVGWWLRPLSYCGWYTFSPQGYRNVLIDKTEYFFDTYPEENTTISEEFYVTQSGVFSAPVVNIESLYAPHYRANDGFNGTLTSK